MARWRITSAASRKPVELEADEVVELRNGWILLKLNDEPVAALSPNGAMHAVRQAEKKRRGVSS